MFGRDKSDLIEHLPMVPLRDIVVFPHTMIPFVVGRKSSIRAVEQALSRGKRIFLSTQRDATVDNPGPEEINSVGTVASIVQQPEAARRQRQGAGRGPRAGARARVSRGVGRPARGGQARARAGGAAPRGSRA